MRTRGAANHIVGIGVSLALGIMHVRGGIFRKPAGTEGVRPVLPFTGLGGFLRTRVMAVILPKVLESSGAGDCWAERGRRVSVARNPAVVIRIEGRGLHLGADCPPGGCVLVLAGEDSWVLFERCLEACPAKAVKGGRASECGDCLPGAVLGGAVAGSCARWACRKREGFGGGVSLRHDSVGPVVGVAFKGAKAGGARIHPAE